ncbi:MAG: hypothetical protein MUP67_09680 [Acidimicrobiia bacterium]|nr:hypothetical protein [Acidimicrobiia bacterium]
MPVRRAFNDTMTQEATRESGETVREFDLRSAATVLGAAIGALFLVFYVLAFVPWLLANGMTAAVEGMMNQVGFDQFNAETLGDWVLVLLVGALFTAFITALVVGILWLYNLLSERTGMGLRMGAELPAGEQPAAIEAPPAKRAPAKRTPAKRPPAKKATAATKKRPSPKRAGTTKSTSATKRRR